MPMRTRSAFKSVIGWLRAGYPDEAPPRGYSPLLALHGPMALTRQQTRQIIDELDGARADVTDIKVAVTKATGLLPTEIQIRTVIRALHRR